MRLLRGSCSFCLLHATTIAQNYSALAFRTSTATISTHRHNSNLSISRRTIATTKALKMGWSDTWEDILQGGNPRWKIVSEESHEKALTHFERAVGKSTPIDSSSSSISVFCPLAGDDPMVHLLWKNGYSVTSIDLVPAAVEAMRDRFKEGSWTKSERDGGSTTVWSHESGRATLLVGDALQSRSELVNQFDAVYDKDSFGALQKEMRSGFCKRIAEYCKKDATVYVEVKLKEDHEEVKSMGPPYSLKKEDLMDGSSYGSSFDYVEGLGSVYEIPMPSMQQTGHVLRKR